MTKSSHRYSHHPAQQAVRYASLLRQCDVCGARRYCLTRVMFAAVVPEIEVAEEKVHSGEGHEAHLVCKVHGQPMPTVRDCDDKNG